MTPVLALAAALAVVIGVVLGMLGGGGAVLTLPMLVYAVGVDPKVAIASSLFVVGVTSALGVVLKARAVAWKDGALFGGAAMAGAFAGGHLAKLFPGTVLLVVFGALIVVAAGGMLRGRREATEHTARAVNLPLMLGLGASVGLLSGLVGAGGGFMIVPALVLVAGLPMRRAIATSLLVITVQSFAGFLGHVSHVTLDWPLVLTVTGASVVGSFFGAWAGGKVAPATLRKVFAWLIAAMGLFMFGKQLPPVLAAVVIAATTAALLFVALKARRDDALGLAETR